MGARRLCSRCSILLVLVTAAAVLGSSLARAADPAQNVARVGFVHPSSPSTDARRVDGFWQRLRELGWVEGQNMLVEARWADGRIDRLPALMTEVVERKVDVLVTWSTPAGIAAKKATSTIPIVDAAMGDPIGTGLATSLAHPGGNLTGLSDGYDDIGGKWLELLQETVPHLSAVAFIGDPDNPIVGEMAQELEAIAPTRRIKSRLMEVRNPETLHRAFQRARREAQAILVLGGPFVFGHRREVTALAARYRIPAMYPLREYMDFGGLMTYSADHAVQWRRAAEYVDNILKGAKPGDLPIEQPTKFELVVNLKTAKALGITIPESILLRADEVIR